MSIYLESFLEMFLNSKYLFTEDDNKKAPGQLKSTYTNALRAHKTDLPKTLTAGLGGKCPLSRTDGGPQNYYSEKTIPITFDTSFFTAAVYFHINKGNDVARQH